MRALTAREWVKLAVAMSASTGLFVYTIHLSSSHGGDVGGAVLAYALAVVYSGFLVFISLVRPTDPVGPLGRLRPLLPYFALSYACLALARIVLWCLARARV